MITVPDETRKKIWDAAERAESIYQRILRSGLERKGLDTLLKMNPEELQQGLLELRQIKEVLTSNAVS